MGSWKRCVTEGSTKEAHCKQEKTKIKNGTCNILKPEIVENNRNKTVRNRKWLEKYAIPNIAEIIYTRDEYGNITYIDGIPIEEKYRVIKNRHWVLSSGEITSKQQKAIRNNGEPVCGPRGYLYNNDSNITHIDGIPIEEKYEAIATDILDIKNSLVISTGREQNSSSWVGKEAFDQFLISLGIGWFVYIKYDELSNPLVVGKTSTRKVSNSINDIIFDYLDTNHGPARQYLRDNNLDWDKTKVLIVPCETEQEALNKEKEIHDKYNLFYS